MRSQLLPLVTSWDCSFPGQSNHLFNTLTFQWMSLYSVPPEVLQVKYSTACRILTDQLACHETTSSTALLKSVGPSHSPYMFPIMLPLLSLQLLQALTLLLGAQPVGIWSDSHCQRVFQTVLNFTVHPKPRV